MIINSSLAEDLWRESLIPIHREKFKISGPTAGGKGNGTDAFIAAPDH